MKETSTTFFALLREQLKKMTSFLTKDMKTGKRHSGGKIAFLLFVCLLVYVANVFLFEFPRYNLELSCYYLKYAYFIRDGNWALWALILGSIFGIPAACFLLYPEDEPLSVQSETCPWKLVTVRLISVFLPSYIGVRIILHTEMLLDSLFGHGSVCYKLAAILICSLLALDVSCLFGFFLSRIMRNVRHKVLITGIYLIVSEAALWLLAKNALRMLNDIPGELVTKLTFGEPYWWLYFLGSAIGSVETDSNPEYLAVLGAAAVLLFILIFCVLSLRQSRRRSKIKITD